MSRILLELEHKENRRLLAEWLRDDYQVVLPDTEQDLAESFDLCLLDGPTLNRLWQELLAKREGEQPAFLPFLLVTPRQRVGMFTSHLKQCIDEVITSPIEKAELRVRMETLLRARRFTLDLKAANSRLQQTLGQLEEDQKAGRLIQFQLLPEDHKVYGAYRFSRTLYPSTYLSGDFVDYFFIDPEHLGFYIADVSGHGVSSAFVTVLLKSHMSRYLEQYREGSNAAILDPAEILARLNRDLLGGHMDKYLTMFYGLIERPANRLRYANGGQFPLPILFDGKQARFIGKKSQPVGLFDFAQYSVETMELPPRFSLAMMSDGLLDLLAQTNLEEKLNYLLDQVALSTELTTESLVQQLVPQESGQRPDDVTLLLISKRAG